MLLFGLLLVPVVITAVAYLCGKGKISPPEVLVQLGFMLMLISAGYYIALSNRTSDFEHWNGTIATKTVEKVSCCHSYECNCHETCSGSGSNRSCSRYCSTCYEHSSDREYEALTSNNEVAFRDGCNSPSSNPPWRWQQIQVGEPTSIEHQYDNYIKGNPDSILRRQGFAKQYAGAVPHYPRVGDYYRATKVIEDGVKVPRIAEVNQRLNDLNARLGSKKGVNVILVVTSRPNQEFAEAIREEWLGGKKNDVVVVVGAPQFPKMSWVSVISWTKSEQVKVDLRDRLLDMGDFDGEKVVGVIGEEVAAKFVHRKMSDFDYLKATIEPSTFAVWTLFTIGVLVSLGLSCLFWLKDPFDTDRAYKRRFYR